MRNRKQRRPRPPRRPSHRNSADCVRLVPPGETDQVFVGFCEELGLWRIKAHHVDLHGTLSADGEAEGFEAALRDAADKLRAPHPDLARLFEDLLDEVD